MILELFLLVWGYSDSPPKLDLDRWMLESSYTRSDFLVLNSTTALKSRIDSLIAEKGKRENFTYKVYTIQEIDDKIENKKLKKTYELRPYYLLKKLGVKR